jgi:hypothetical protein
MNCRQLPLCLGILLSALGCHTKGGGAATTSSSDAGADLVPWDGMANAPADAAHPGPLDDGGELHTPLDSRGADDVGQGSSADAPLVARDASSPDTTSGPFDGSPAPSPDGLNAPGPDGSSVSPADGPGHPVDTMPGTSEAGAECSKISQAADAKVVDEIYQRDITERTGGFFQPGTYALAQLVEIVSYSDPRLGTKTGRSVQETWRVRRAGDASQYETYVDVVRDGLGAPSQQSATFHMELLRDSGPGGDDVWKLTRVCGDSSLDDLDGAVLDVDMPLVSIGLAWGTSGKTKDGKSWRRRYYCMGQACRG